ncbi:MAG: sensor histidine kinase [Anaerovoracaceae bacterium]
MKIKRSSSMKLKNRMILLNASVAVFLVLALTAAYGCCEILCSINPMLMKSGMLMFLGFGIIALTIAILFSIWMSNKISKPLQTVTERAKRITAGDYKEIIETKSDTVEIDALIESINSLARSLDAQQSIKRQMARDYAHEIRTPLAAISNTVECIAEGVFEPSKERLESIQLEITRLTRLLSQMEYLVEIETDKIELSKENFDFGKLVKQVLRTLEAEGKKKNITINLMESPCEIYGDLDKITSLIINLISNAIKYTDKNGRIDITVDKTVAGCVELKVQDNGIGISKENLPQIFEHLYRVDESRSRTSGGSGIGLAVVKAIVTAHGGKIEVASEIEKGSIFTVTLPCK